jgi:trehalose synthase
VDQIVSGEHGLLVDDPRDPAEFGQAVRRLLDDPPYAELLGENARQRATAKFLGDRHLEQYAQLFEQLDRAR